MIRNYKDDGTVGLFSKFKDFREKQSEKKITKYRAVIRNPKAIKETRWEAIEYMKAMSEPEIAVPALIQRFEFSLEHGINDTREKEACMDGIVRHGETALTYVSDHLKSTTRIAWPIKILKALGKDSQVIDILKEALSFDDVAFDQAQVDKNYDILCYLADYQLGDFVDRVAHFLNDPDERVRFACAELLIDQDQQGISNLLEKFLADKSSENIRIHKTVIDAFAAKGWKVASPDAFENGVIADGVKVQSDGTVLRS